MENSQIMMALFAVALCVVPVWWLVYAGNAKNRLLKATLKKLTGQKKLSENAEIWADRGLALHSGKLYFITVKENAIESQSEIDLSEVEDCEIVMNGSIVLKNEAPGLKGLRTLTLRIFLAGGKKQEINLYNSIDDDAFEITRDFEIGKRWRGIIIENRPQKAATVKIRKGETSHRMVG